MDLEKKLYKSNKNKMIDGVCGGIGEYCNIDPTIIRLVFVALCIFAGGGLLAYIVALIVIPRAPEGYDPQAAAPGASADAAAQTAEPKTAEHKTAHEESTEAGNSDSNTPTMI